MTQPDADGLWNLEKINKGAPPTKLMAVVNLAKQEVYLPTSDAPYRLADLVGDSFKWSRIPKEEGRHDVLPLRSHRRLA